MITLRGIVVIALLVTVHGFALSAQEPSLETVLTRAAAYVSALHEQLSGIVAEESYVQEARNRSASHLARNPTSPHRVRLKSDLLLVRPADSERYVEFRDVFEVNGSAVRDRADRLSRLFLDPQGNANQVRAIIDESARTTSARSHVI